MERLAIIMRHRRQQILFSDLQNFFGRKLSFHFINLVSYLLLMKNMSILAMMLVGFCVSAVQAAERDFWISDTSKFPPVMRQRPVDLRAERKLADGTMVAFWLEKGIQTSSPNEAALNDFIARLTKEGGPFDIEKKFVGNQPTPASQDRAVNIVLAALPPMDFMGYKLSFDGFSSLFDLMSEEEAAKLGQHSNERNVVYLNALNAIDSKFMERVAVREFTRLLTIRNGAIEAWAQEAVVNAGLELAEYAPAAMHTKKYLERTYLPIATSSRNDAEGLLFLGRYLAKRREPATIKAVIDAKSTFGFRKIESAYQTSWADLFADYASWLFSQKPAIFDAVTDTVNIAPTGVLYFSKAIDVTRFKIASTPKACANSKNEIKTIALRSPDLDASAVWVESSPPCVAQADPKTKKLEFFGLVR